MHAVAEDRGRPGRSRPSIGGRTGDGPGADHQGVVAPAAPPVPSASADEEFVVCDVDARATVSSRRCIPVASRSARCDGPGCASG